MESDQLEMLDRLIGDLSEFESGSEIDKELLKELPANLKDDGYHYFLSNPKE